MQSYTNTSKKNTEERNMIPTVAFIDDGICNNFVPVDINFTNLYVNETGVHEGVVITDVTHGTLCYKIFDQHTNADYHLVSIKVLKDGTGQCNKLIKALEWCRLHSVDIINISLGTTDYQDFAPIAHAIGLLPDTIIIAACSNDGVISAPACLPSVIAVKHINIKTLDGLHVYHQNPWDSVDVITYAKERTYPLDNGSMMSAGSSNSFAAPLITAKVTSYVASGGRDVREMLYKSASMLGIVDAPFVMLPADFVNIQALLDFFIQDGYRAICLTMEDDTHTGHFIFNIASIDPATIQKYYNFTRSDIIFIHGNMIDASQVDLAISPQDINLPTEALFTKIKKSLS